MPVRYCLIGLLWSCFVASTPRLAAEGCRFEEITIDPNPGKVVYAVTAADVDADGREDILAVTETKVLCYTAPDWTKKVLVDGLTVPDNVCIAPHDIDGDLRIDFALGAGWPKNGGTIQWLRRGKEEDGPWEVHPIAAIPWTHRMKFADVLGTGDEKPQLVVSPLNAAEGESGVELTAYKIPDDPVNDRWVPTVISRKLNRLHNHVCVNADTIDRSPEGNEQAVTLTASQEGVHVIYQTDGSSEVHGDEPTGGDGGTFRGFQLTAGAKGDNPADRGAGEVEVGSLAVGTPFVATIEPMHGTTAAVYLVEHLGRENPPRVVLTDKLKGGHALWTADLDKDGDDEVIVGWREPNPEVGISVFDYQAQGKWKEQPVDRGGMACEDVIVGDFDVNGHLDILAGGRATHNIKLYLNHGVDWSGDE